MVTSTIPAINSIPSISTPLVDQNGNMSATWHEYFRNFINNTVQVENTVTTVVNNVTPGAGLKLDPESTASNVILDVSAGPGLVANASNLTMDIHDLGGVQAAGQQEIMLSDPQNNNTVSKTTLNSVVALASSAPAGPTTAVQVNKAGVTYGDSNFTYDGAGNVTIGTSLFMGAAGNAIFWNGGNKTTFNYSSIGGIPLINGGTGISMQFSSASITMAVGSGVSCIWSSVAGTMALTGLSITTNGTTTTTGVILTKVNATEASNAVTASGYSGVITTSSLTTAASGSYVITWTNTKIATTSVIHLTLMGGTNTTSNVTVKATAGAGTSTLTIVNDNTLTALNGTILIGYIVV